MDAPDDPWSVALYPGMSRMSSGSTYEGPLTPLPHPSYDRVPNQVLNGYEMVDIDAQFERQPTQSWERNGSTSAFDSIHDSQVFCEGGFWPSYGFMYDGVAIQASHSGRADRHKRRLSSNTHHLEDQFQLITPDTTPTATFEREWSCDKRPCPSAKSKGCAPTFATRSDREEHYKEVHSCTSDGEQLDGLCCPFLHCGRSSRAFASIANLKRHLQKVHHTDPAPFLRTLSKSDEHPKQASEEEITKVIGGDYYRLRDVECNDKGPNTSECMHIDGVKESEDLQPNYAEKTFVPKRNAGLQCPICAYEDLRIPPFEFKSKFIEHVLAKHQIKDLHTWLGEEAVADRSATAQTQSNAEPTSKQSEPVTRDSPQPKDNPAIKNPQSTSEAGKALEGNTDAQTKSVHASPNGDSERDKIQQSAFDGERTNTEQSAGASLKDPALKPMLGSPSSSYSSSARFSLPESSSDEISTTSSPASEISDTTVTNELNAYAQNFVAALARRIVRQCMDLDEKTFKACTGNRDGKGGSTAQQYHGSMPTTSQNSSHKRARPDDNQGAGNPDDRSDDGNNADNPSKRPCLPTPASKRFWACPYTKFDPLRYSEHNLDEKQYRKCASATLTDISKLKQHLRRTHLEPKHFCGNCYETFVRKKALLQHNKTACSVSPPKYEEMMNEDQSLLIPTYLPNNSSSWYRIYGILFEDAPLPVSPYITISNTSQIQQFMSLFQLIGPTEFLGVLSAGLERNPQSLQFNVSLRDLIEETFETAFPEYLDLLRVVASGGATQSSVDTAGELPLPADFDFGSQDPSLLAGNQDVVSQNSDSNAYIEASNWRSQPAMIAQAFTSFTIDRCNELGLPGGMSLPEDPAIG